jgi:hypothetical protein
MNRKPSLNEEVMAVLVAGVLGFVIMLSLTSCSTTSVYGCENLLGPDKDRCLQDNADLDAMQRRRETIYPR